VKKLSRPGLTNEIIKRRVILIISLKVPIQRGVFCNVDMFKDIVNSCSDESTNTTPTSMCTKLLMNTVKRDIPAVEASYELSRLPLNRSSPTFQNISLSGSALQP
jgi:hypothetical protein